MSFSISGKTAIVTGAASGVGLAIARHFAEQGANVMFADSDVKGLKSELESDSSNTGSFVGDFREKLAQTNLINETISRFERIDILINAARQVTLSDTGNGSSEVLESMIDQNFRQHYDLSWLIAGKFKEQKSKLDNNDSIGAIVNISSIAAQRIVPELVEYSVSCAALDQLTKSMAVTLAKSRIRVNAVSFGSVMSKSLVAKLNSNPGHRKLIEEATPLGRIADAKDVASAVQFLASDSSRFVTGQILNVDGGRSLLDRSSSPFH